MTLRLTFIAAECEPWAKTGGLADVVDALARALGEIGETALETPVDVFLPRYQGIEAPAGSTALPVHVPDPYALGGFTEVDVLEVAADGYRLRLVDHPPAYDRPGYYGDARGDFGDNAWRFGLLCRAAIETLRLEGRPPDVLHLHDWHAAPALLLRDLADLEGDRFLRGTAAILTVHNLAYHGWVSGSDVNQLGLVGGDGIAPLDGGGLDLLAAAIVRADLVNTVSPGFAEEARTPAFGMGLDGLLRERGDRFFGILNGLDTDAWDPASDRVIAATYSAADRSGKATCRSDLLVRLGLTVPEDGTVLGMIGRLEPQKGFDLLAAAAPALLERGATLVIQGSGDPALVTGLRRLATEHPDRVAIIERFDREMARRIYAGADAFLMPSRFEPCGTGQMIAMRYGTPPIVHATGGLRDTVVDEHDEPGAGTGFVFRHATAEGLLWACEQAIALRRAPDAGWDALLDRAMAADFAWRASSAPAYVAAYERAVRLRRFSARGRRGRRV